MNRIQISVLAAACLFLACGMLFPGALAPEDEAWTQDELEAITIEIQAEVEQIRGQEFKRPVAVKVTDKEGFISYVMKRLDQMGGPEKMEAEADIVKMLGLVPASMDYLQVTLDMLEGQVGGFYDPSSETFYLMDSFTGAIAKVILAHELTHALDDQYYDIDGKFEERLDDRDASSAYSSVVEGSGTSLMTLWTMKHIGELSPDDLQKIAEMSTESLDGIPAVMWKPMLGSYTQGQSFLNKGYRLLKKQGKKMSDITQMAFEDPPMTTEQILHPEKYWDSGRRDDPRLLVLEGGELPEGWRLIENSTVGELTLALLAEEEEEVDFTNPMEVSSLTFTNDAARGWDGDRLVLYGNNGEGRFLKLVTLWDTEEDAREFELAMQARLESWRKTVAELDSEGEGRGSQVLVEGNPEEQRVTIQVWHGVAPSSLEALSAERIVEVTDSASR